MKLKLLFLLICCQLMFAQGANTDRAIKIVRVHGDAIAIYQLVKGVPGVDYQADRALRAIVLKGPTAELAQLERTIQELDSLSSGGADSSNFKNVETSIYMIGASQGSITGMLDPNGETLTPVLKQLRSIFPYKNYQLLSMMLMRSAQTVKAETAGLMKAVQPVADRWPTPAQYKIAYDSASVSKESPALIHIANLRVSVSMPVMTGLKPKDAPFASTQFQMQNVGISTDVDLREGQKIVVGNVDLADADVCLFLVLSARLVQ
jgi:hypothetical protein